MLATVVASPLSFLQPETILNEAGGIAGIDPESAEFVLRGLAARFAGTAATFVVVANDEHGLAGVDAGLGLHAATGTAEE